MKYFFWLFSFILTGCPVYDPPSGGLNIKNMTNETVYVYLTCEETLSVDYPLRLYFERGNEFDAEGNSLRGQRFYLNYRIEPDSSSFLSVGGTPNEPNIDCVNKKINLFMIKESVMQDYTWAEIVSAKRFQKKMEFTQQQLDSMNWVVEYFP